MDFWRTKLAKFWRQSFHQLFTFGVHVPYKGDITGLATIWRHWQICEIPQTKFPTNVLLLCQMLPMFAEHFLKVLEMLKNREKFPILSDPHCHETSGVGTLSLPRSGPI